MPLQPQTGQGFGEGGGGRGSRRGGGRTCCFSCSSKKETKWEVECAGCQQAGRPGRAPPSSPRLAVAQRPGRGRPPGRATPAAPGPVSARLWLRLGRWGREDPGAGLRGRRAARGAAGSPRARCWCALARSASARRLECTLRGAVQRRPGCVPAGDARAAFLRAPASGRAARQARRGARGEARTPSRPPVPARPLQPGQRGPGWTGVAGWSRAGRPLRARGRLAGCLGTAPGAPVPLARDQPPDLRPSPG